MQIENKPLAIGVAVFLVCVAAAFVITVLSTVTIKVDFPKPLTPAGSDAR